MHGKHVRDMTIVLTVAWLGACGENDTRQPESQPPTTQAQTQASTAQLPDTTAQALWAYLHQQDYRSWPMWPGKGELYAGTEPHGALLTTHVNRLALDALESGAAMMPNGAILVKENFSQDSTLMAITAMYKVPGYNPSANDWFWAKYDTAGVAEVSGRAEGCENCHGERRAQDYLMTPRPNEAGG